MTHRDEEQVGYKKPPRATRFSRENQPQRPRRSSKPRPKGGFHGHILEALAEKVSLSRNGKPIKADVMLALARKCVQEAFAASLREKTNFFLFLQKIGLLEVLELKEQLEEEMRAQERSYRELKDELAGFTRAGLERASACAEVASMAVSLISDARETCTCGTFDGPLKQAYEDMERWLADDGASEEQKMAELIAKYGCLTREETHRVWGPPATGKTPEGVDLEHQQEDEFYSGMIGHK